MQDGRANTPLTTTAEESVTPGGRQRPSGAGRRGRWGSGRKTGMGEMDLTRDQLSVVDVALAGYILVK